MQIYKMHREGMRNDSCSGSMIIMHDSIIVLGGLSVGTVKRVISAENKKSVSQTVHYAIHNGTVRSVEVPDLYMLITCIHTDA